MPEFYVTFARIFMRFARKMPEFYMMKIAQKYFSRIRGHVPPAPRLLRLWETARLTLSI